MVHGFTCAGILPSQYMNLNKFAGIGRVGGSYIRRGWKCLSSKLYTLMTCILI